MIEKNTMIEIYPTLPMMPLCSKFLFVLTNGNYQIVKNTGKSGKELQF